MRCDEKEPNSKGGAGGGEELEPGSQGESRCGFEDVKGRGGLEWPASAGRPCGQVRPGQQEKGNLRKLSWLHLGENSR